MWSGHEPSKYTYLTSLAHGSFGRVSLVQGEHGVLYAVKSLPRSSIASSNRARHVVRESLTHKILPPHPNVIGVREVMLDAASLHIVMEYAEGGDLSRLLARTGKFSEVSSRYCFQQIICALDALHNHGLAHRDVKLENVLVSSTECGMLMKLCDFGYCTELGDESASAKGLVGTPQYVAPEMIQQQRYDARACDVWSTGVLLYTLLVGAFPFTDPENRRERIFANTLQQELTLPPRLGLSAGASDLLLRMLTKDPARRITIPEIKRHPWYRDLLPVEVESGYAQCTSPAVWFPPSGQTVRQIISVLKEAMGSSGGPSAGAGSGASALSAERSCSGASTMEELSCSRSSITQESCRWAWMAEGEGGPRPEAEAAPHDADADAAPCSPTTSWARTRPRSSKPRAVQPNAPPQHNAWC